MLWIFRDCSHSLYDAHLKDEFDSPSPNGVQQLVAASKLNIVLNLESGWTIRAPEPSAKHKDRPPRS